MDRLEMTSEFGVPQTPNFSAVAPSQISLPPKPHFLDQGLLTLFRPEPVELAGDRRGQTTDDTEISIFEAERYFNESHDSGFTSKDLTVTLNPATQKCYVSPHPCDSSDSSFSSFSRNFRNRSIRETPTASSYASSNSQARFLRKSQASLSVSDAFIGNDEQRKEPYFSAKRLFCYACPCSSKKSVDVKETYFEHKNAISSSYVSDYSSLAKLTGLQAEQDISTKEGVEQMARMNVFSGILPQDPKIFCAPRRCFSLGINFPTSEIASQNVNPGGFSFPELPPRNEQGEDDPPRVSLEVFRLAETATPITRLTEIQNSFFPINAEDRWSSTFTGSPKTQPVEDDDVASDTSSDLFEIASLSTQMGWFQKRDTLDEFSSSLIEPRKNAGSAAVVAQLRGGVDDEEVATPSTAPSECYPPSEVSVEWSVTTAEGFDRSSVANFSSEVSEYEQLRHAVVALSGGKMKGIGGGGSGGLLSCRSEKAVSVVGPNTAWFGSAVKRRLGNSAASVGLERVVGVAQLGSAKPLHDGSANIGLRSRTRFA